MAIQLEQLTLSTLSVLDPRIEALFQSLVQRISQDCISRPADETARKVLIELSVVPTCDPSDPSICDRVTMAVGGKAVVPPYKTKAFQLRPSKAGLAFQPDDSEAVDQYHIPFSEKD